MKIENKPLAQRSSFDVREFYVTLGILKIGQSFIVPQLTTNHRSALTYVGYAMNRKFSCRTIVGGFRIGRI